MKILFSLLFLISLVLLIPVAKGQVLAADLQFDKTTVTVNPGETFQIGVVVNAGTDQISSTDVYVLYDSNLLQAQSVAAGSFFPTVTNNITTGKVYIAGLVDDPTTYETGSGTLATITFKALANGSGTLTFDCNQTAYTSSKIIKNDLNATNIIVCSSNGTSTITVGTGSSGSGTSLTPTPSALPQTGVVEDFGKAVIPGILLLGTGMMLQFLIKFIL